MVTREFDFQILEAGDRRDCVERAGQTGGCGRDRAVDAFTGHQQGAFDALARAGLTERAQKRLRRRDSGKTVKRGNPDRLHEEAHTGARVCPARRAVNPGGQHDRNKFGPLELISRKAAGKNAL